jgi:hypothetical protein
LTTPPGCSSLITNACGLDNASFAAMGAATTGELLPALIRFDCCRKLRFSF